ncbi:LysR family transcriptional regulator [Sphingomonas quercus]|uniref:LysR family transcriptional regulator n=1 Tax=Sphingomonas quercus TaxID=2842451 RepID=A0ABS6BLK9_9SPHN|nr:LysR family transcriptional regulator [Sphingomonas quercus]MBU3078717.1 LysR family transcriptional regulator [Sphingomonas quercus]
MALPDFEGWAIFVAVIEAGSFAGAADALGLSRATVSKAVARLEARLGTTLIHRTSRRIAPSEAGRAALARARRMLDEGEAADAEAAAGSASPRGPIRLAAPMSFGVAHVGPLLPAFAARYPEVTVDLHLSDARVDLVGGGFDLAIRIAELADSSLRARRLCAVKRPLVAAPAYLDRHGRPGHPRELERHLGLLYTNLPQPDLWRFRHPRLGEAAVRVPGRARANNGEVLLPLLLAGEGLAYFPDFLVWRELAAGRLEEVLPEWRLPDIAAHILMPPGAARPARVELLIDHLVRALARPPWRAAGAGP